jgi:hypothetical protein
MLIQGGGYFIALRSDRKNIFLSRGAPKGGGAAGVYPTPHNRNLKQTDFVDIMVLW